jgi:predicted DsbA family dithiol-disulfide isomerase
LSATDFRRFIESDKGLEEVLKEEAQGKQRGLNGVPFFFINGVPAFSGAQQPETFVAVFRQVLEMDAPKRGLDTCLSDAAKSNLRSAPK